MKPKHVKCIVMNCVNHRDEGKFIGQLCSPCYSFIVKGEGIHSQAYRNAVATNKEPIDIVPICYVDWPILGSHPGKP